MLIEAALAELPIIANDLPSARFTLENNHRIADLTVPGILAQELLLQRQAGRNPEKLRRARARCLERFSEETIAEGFVRAARRSVSARTGRTGWT